MFKMTKLMRLFKILSKKKVYIQNFQKYYKRAGYDRVIFMVMTFIIISHLFTCMWVYLPVIFDQEDDKERP